MGIYVVRMEHPDGEGWNRHVLAHVRYLKGLIAQGRLLASGPLKGTSLRAGFLIMVADNRQQVEAMVDDDPFTKEGLICALTIEEWDPLFGMLAEKSSGLAPPELSSLC
jgi:hypothetical protein